MNNPAIHLKLAKLTHDLIMHTFMHDSSLRIKVNFTSLKTAL